MKVFISWSGEDSKQIASLLAEWLGLVLKVDPWISSDDIEKGSLWMTDISDQLRDITVGILCLTRENINAPWILFEAGALSKGLSKSRVCPLLIDISPKDLKPPLSIFNATMPHRDDMQRLIRTINEQGGKDRLKEQRLQQAFRLLWPHFEEKFETIVRGFKQKGIIQKRPVEDMVAEILELARSIQRNLQTETTSNTISPERLFETFLNIAKTQSTQRGVSDSIPHPAATHPSPPRRQRIAPIHSRH